MPRIADGSSYISVPLLYPSGSFVTVRIFQVGNNIFRVTDNGFAYREIESIGAQRSFSKMANAIVVSDNLIADKRRVYVDVPKEHLVSAICEIAAATWKIADRIYSKAAELEEVEIEDFLRERLASIFGESQLRVSPEIIGASTTKWPMSAVVDLKNDGVAVFQAVSNHPNSVYKANSAFHDLGLLKAPPHRIAVVRDKALMGTKLALVSQSANVIQENQSDDVFRRAAA